MSRFDAAKFAEWLTEAYKKSSFKSYAQLGEAAGTTRATVSNLIGAKEQLLTGKPSQPKPDLVKRLAVALNEDVDAALTLAGHAAQKQFPDFLYKIDFSIFSPIDLMEIESFIKFKLSQKKDAPAIAYGRIISGEEYLSREDAAKFERKKDKAA